MATALLGEKGLAVKDKEWTVRLNTDSKRVMFKGMNATVPYEMNDTLKVRITNGVHSFSINGWVVYVEGSRHNWYRRFRYRAFMLTHIIVKAFVDMSSDGHI